VYSAAGKTDRVAHLRSLSEDQKEKKKLHKKILIIGAAILAAILLIIISSKISQARKYSENNIKLKLVNTESVQVPLTQFDLQIKNGCTKELYRIKMTFYFYDSQDNLIVSTGLNTFCNLSPKEEATWTITLHESAAADLYPYYFEELKVTAAIENLHFSYPDHIVELGEGKERVLQKAEKPDASKLAAVKQKLEDAFTGFDPVRVTDFDFEGRATDFATVLDELWEDIIRNEELLSRVYEKAAEYESDEQYEKAYYLFTLLASVDYKDSEDRAYTCAMQTYY